MTYGAAETAGGYGFLAVFVGGLAFRRYEHDHELNSAAHRGAEQVEKFMELAVILLLGSCSRPPGCARRAGRAGCSRWCCSWSSARSASSCSLYPLERRAAGGRAFVAWFGVRGIGTLSTPRPSSTAGVLAGAEEQLVRLAGDRLRDRLHRCPRRHRRPRAAAAVPDLRDEEREAPTPLRPHPLQRRRRLPH